MSALEVAGYCPMGCGRYLVVGGDGRIACSWHACPRPDAVNELLSDPEADHVVDLGEDTFAIQHPLRERLDGELFSCSLHHEIAASDGPPELPGRYRVTSFDNLWEELS